MAQTRDEVIQAITKWQKENIVRVVVKLNKTNDADILEHLDKVNNRQGYIKDLIRKDIGK